MNSMKWKIKTRRGRRGGLVPGNKNPPPGHHHNSGEGALTDFR